MRDTRRRSRQLLSAAAFRTTCEQLDRTQRTTPEHTRNPMLNCDDEHKSPRAHQLGLSTHAASAPHRLPHTVRNRPCPSCAAESLSPCARRTALRSTRLTAGVCQVRLPYLRIRASTFPHSIFRLPPCRPDRCSQTSHGYPSGGHARNPYHADLARSSKELVSYAMHFSGNGHCLVKSPEFFLRS